MCRESQEKQRALGNLRVFLGRNKGRGLRRSVSQKNGLSNGRSKILVVAPTYSSCCFLFKLDKKFKNKVPPRIHRRGSGVLVIVYSTRFALPMVVAMMRNHILNFAAPYLDAVILCLRNYQRLRYEKGGRLANMLNASVFLQRTVVHVDQNTVLSSYHSDQRAQGWGCGARLRYERQCLGAGSSKPG